MTDRMQFYIKGSPLLDAPYHLKGVGLPNIYLSNGVVLEDDADYGRLITIENLPALHRAIGLHIVNKPLAMTGAELRFLRKQMQLSQTELAKRLRVDVQTVANYEKEKTRMGAAETAVRVFYILHILPAETPAGLVRGLVDGLSTTVPSPKLSEPSRRKIAGRWREAVPPIAA